MRGLLLFYIVIIVKSNKKQTLRKESYLPSANECSSGCPHMAIKGIATYNNNHERYSYKASNHQKEYTHSRNDNILFTMMSLRQTSYAGSVVALYGDYS